MDELLQLNSQNWKLWSSDGLKLFLPRSKNGGRIYFTADWRFVHPDITDDNFSFNTAKLATQVTCSVPDLRDWHDLAGCVLGGNDANEDDDNFCCHGPDLFVYQPKQDEEKRPDCWDTKFTFGARNDYEFEFEMTAFRPSDRASEFRRDYQVNQLLGKPVPPEWELPDWLDEGDTLSFNGKICLQKIFCTVPINCSRPIEWAKQMARKELNMHEFGFCHVNGGDYCNGQFKPHDGVGGEGRLVLLEPPSDYFYKWQEQQQQRPKD